MSLGRWVPPLGWMGVIFWLSGSAGAQEATASWVLPLLQALLPRATADQLAFLHFLLRKLGHVVEYALLAFLWRRALVPGPRRARPRKEWEAFAITFGYAILDELHQGWTGIRSASVSDVILDAGAAAAALLTLRRGWRWALACLTTALLWLTAVGGTLLLGFHLSLGLAGGWLWISVPLAWILLWAWRQHRRPRPFPLDAP